LSETVTPFHLSRRPNQKAGSGLSRPFSSLALLRRNFPLFGKRLTTRKSFALWIEEVKGKSAPWKDCEVDAARALRRSILETVGRKAEELSKLNAELERSNVERDSFAFITSHDLKEPLRGIHNYSHMLIES